MEIFFLLCIYCFLWLLAKKESWNGRWTNDFVKSGARYKIGICIEPRTVLKIPANIPNLNDIIMVLVCSLRSCISHKSWSSLHFGQFTFEPSNGFTGERQFILKCCNFLFHLTLHVYDILESAGDKFLDWNFDTKMIELGRLQSRNTHLILNNTYNLYHDCMAH